MAFETVNIGSSPKSATAGDRYTFSKVRLIDQKTGDVYESGNDTGRTFVYKAPVGASQQLADALANKLGGKMYTAFEASRSRVDPAAEIGDCIEDSTGRLTGAMCTQTLNFGSGYSTCGAPGFEETEAEYPQKTELDKAISYTNGAIGDYGGGEETGLRVEVVEHLPTGHENQNVLWAIPEDMHSAKLGLISVEGGDSTLTPAFDPEVTEYEVNFIKTRVVTVHVSAASPDAVMQFRGHDYTSSFSFDMNLSDGSTYLNRVTVSNGGSSTTYRIGV